MRGFTFGNQTLPPVQPPSAAAAKQKQRAALSVAAKKRGSTWHHLNELIVPYHQQTKRGMRIKSPHGTRHSPTHHHYGTGSNTSGWGHKLLSNSGKTKTKDKE